MVKKCLLKVFNCLWVGGWLAFFVWSVGDDVPKLPVWLQIVVLVLVLGFSSVWLFVANAKVDTDR